MLSQSNSNLGAPFHCIAYEFSCADWDCVCDNFRDVPCEDIFKFNASAAASEFWVQVGIDQVKSHSFPWFSAVCAAAIFHRNHFFRFYQQNKSSES